MSLHELISCVFSDLVLEEKEMQNESVRRDQRRFNVVRGE